jgi:hypothetical protein
MEVSMVKRHLIGFIVLLLAAGLLAGCEPARTNDGILKWNDDHTVKEGETVEGDLTLLNGDATVEAGGTVDGSLVVWNGNAIVEGTVKGNLVVTNGDIYLGDDARVEGDVICSGNCELEQEESAYIDGSIIESVPIPSIPDIRFNGGELPILTTPPINVRFLGPGWLWESAAGFVRRVTSVVLIAAIAALVGLMLPQQMTRVGQTMVKDPLPSFGYGLLTAFAATTAILILTLTICFSLVGFLAAIALFAAGLYGWICFGAVVGKRLLEAFKAHGVAPVWSAGLGTLIVTLVATLVTFLLDVGQIFTCCLQPLAWIAIFVLGCAGLGAVVLTRFGTQAYPPGAGLTSSASAAAEAPEPSMPAEEEKG